MHEVLIDGTLYRRCATAEEAEATRASLRRWASTSTRIETRPAAPAVGDVATRVAIAPPDCDACGGTGVARRLAWVGARGGWCFIAGDGPCRACAEDAAA